MYNKSGIKITGIGSFQPISKITNEDYTKYLDTSDEWIIARTGIKERRFHFNGTNSEMAIESAKNAIADAGCSPLDIDYIILSTATPDYFYPTLSCNVAKAIGAANAACVDISAACTGFVAALDIAHSYLKAGIYKKILVIASEKLSSHVDFYDRSSCVLFGDGAGAVVVEQGNGLYTSHIGTIPEDSVNMSIYCKVKYLDNPGYPKEWNIPSDTSNNTPQLNVSENFPPSKCEKCHYLQMDGTAVYKFAIEAMPLAVKKALAVSDMSIKDLDLLIPHQANIRIIKSAVKALRIPMSKVYVNIEKRGNTSSSCIPTCLDELKKSGKLKKGMKICFVAFGAGLTYGAICFEY